MFKKFTQALGILTVSILAVSCSSFLPLEKPEVELTEVYAKDATATDTTLVFVVKVDNPNKQEIKVKEVAYKVFISGKELSSAKTEKPIIVPAKSSASAEIPLPVNYGKLLGNVAEILFNRAVTYRIEGTAKLSFVSIPFSKEGKVELR